MLGSWLAGRLGWKVQVGRASSGKETAWRFHARRGRGVAVHPPPGRRAGGGALHAPGGEDRRQIWCRCDLEAESAQRLSMHIEGADTQPRTVTVPPATPVELIGRQLSDRERDPVFRESMATAAVMAQSLLQ